MFLMFSSCPKCYPTRRYREHPVTGHTLIETYRRTQETMNKLRRSPAIDSVVEIWACQWDAMREERPETADFLKDNCISLEALNPRDAFYGGRVNGFKLRYTPKQDEIIKYMDIVSLYPYVQKTKRFPVGHPRVLLGAQIDQPIGTYFGLVKCIVLPPRDLDPPFLPAKINGKLVFGLCRTCCEQENQGICNHPPSLRWFPGTWTTFEIDHAQTLNYKVLQCMM